MRAVHRFLLAGGFLLLAAPLLWAQAGRYVPLPRAPGGGGHFVPHVPYHSSSSGADSDPLWLVAGVLGLLFVGFVGWRAGRALARRRGRAALQPHAAAAGPKYTPPVEEDLLLPPFQVQARAEQTTRLLDYLAYRDPAYNPAALREGIRATFQLVQQCWQRQDYGPVRDLLTPALLHRHEELLRAMRHNGELNCLEDLKLERLDFVHLYCPRATDQQEVTALLTFRAVSYFVSDRTGAFLRGSRSPRQFQEFWVFRRQGDVWRLQAIERSHQSDRLDLPNRVEDLSDEQLERAQKSIVL